MIVTIYVCPFTYLLPQKPQVGQFTIETDLFVDMNMAAHMVTCMKNKLKKKGKSRDLFSPVTAIIP